MTSTDPDSAGLHRRFGLLQATALNMCNMLGAGPFITIPLLMGTMNGPQAMLGWGVALLITMADGLVWSELGAAMPHSGGTYGYLRRSFGQTMGRLMAFLFIWQLVLSGPMEIASALIGIRPYLGFLWPDITEAQMKFVSAAAGAVIVLLLYRRIESIARLTVALWIGVLVTIAVVVGTGAAHFDAGRAFDFPAGWWQPERGWIFWSGFFVSLGAAARVGIYDYLGYYDICYIGDEVKHPGRVIPRSVLFSLVLVALIYAGVNLAMIGTLPWRETAGKENVPIAAMFMDVLHGRPAAILLTALILWTTYAGVFALILGYSRIPYAAARDGGFFKVFAHLHPTEAFPNVSLLVIGALSLVFSFLTLGQVIDMLLTTRIAVQFIGQIGALLWLRKHRADLERPFRMWVYPVPAFIALAGWLFVLGTQPGTVLLYGGVIVLIGVGSYFVWRRVAEGP